MEKHRRCLKMVNRLLRLNVLFTYIPVARAIRAMAIATGKADAEAAEARSQLVRLSDGRRLGQHRQQGLTAHAGSRPGNYRGFSLKRLCRSHGRAFSDSGPFAPGSFRLPRRHGGGINRAAPELGSPPAFTLK